MPFCVNCGNEIGKGTNVCPKCGKDPWKVTVKEKIERKKKEKEITSFLAVVVLLGAIVLFFGAIIWQLGIFGGGPGGVGPSSGGERVGGPAPYHVYRAFDFGSLSPLVVLVGMAIVLWGWSKIYHKVKSIISLSLIMAGVVFMVFGFFIFFFGFHDLLTFTVGETYLKPTFTQQYGWIIESVIFVALGYFLLWLGKENEKSEELSRTISYVMELPISYILLLAVLFIYLFGVHNVLRLEDYTNYRSSLSWIVEVIVFCFPAWFFLMKSDVFRKKYEKKKSLIPGTFAWASFILLCATFVIYTLGVHAAVYQPGQSYWKNFLETFLFALPGILLLGKAEEIRKVRKQGKSLIPKVLLPIAVILAFATLIGYLLGVNGLFDQYYGRMNVEWIYEFLLFGIPAAIMLLKSEVILKKESRKKSIVLRPLMLLFGGILILSAILSFVFGLNNFLYSTEQTWHWLMQTILFLFPGAILVYFAERVSTFTKDIKNLVIVTLFISLLLSLAVSCKNGRCIEVKRGVTCLDSDGGKDYYLKGEVKRTVFGREQSEVEDRCIGKDVREVYCDDVELRYTYYNCPNGCKNGACIKCTDSDGGKNYYVKGYIINEEGIRSDDECNPGPDTTSNTLLEYYCTGNLQEPALGIKFECPYGCKDGACEQEIKTPPINKTCTDSDGGKDYYVFGRTRYGAPSMGDIDYDTCINSDILSEQYCPSPSEKSNELYNCPHGCRDGECLNESISSKCTDSDGGKNYYVKGTLTSQAGETFTDFCKEDTISTVPLETGPILNEMYCYDDYSYSSAEYRCPHGCKDGACIKPYCYDSDGGRDYYKKGFINATSFIVKNSLVEDYCTNHKLDVSAYKDYSGKYLIENYCKEEHTLNPVGAFTVYECPEGCENGKCIGEPLQFAEFTCEPSTPKVGKEVQCDARGSQYNHNEIGEIVQAQWFFGDGTKKTIPPGAWWYGYHAYQKPGSYDITLIVEDDKGSIDSTTRFIEVTY